MQVAGGGGKLHHSAVIGHLYLSFPGWREGGKDQERERGRQGERRKERERPAIPPEQSRREKRGWALALDASAGHERKEQC